MRARTFATPILVVVVALSGRIDGPAPARASGAVSDSAYAAWHPRVLFDAAGLPALRAKVSDGGADDAAYAFILQHVTDVYPNVSLDSLLTPVFAMQRMADIGLVANIESPPDTLARDLGRRLTLYIADHWDVDDDPYSSALRLRALVLGYDMCFAGATPAERDTVCSQVESYVDYMLTNVSYEVWRYRPYVSNKTAMVSAALGLAGVGMRHDITRSLADSAVTAADQFLQAWSNAQLDPNGSYREGVLYGLWSMSHLTYYLALRERVDGVDLVTDAMRSMEDWLAYEESPGGGGSVNNLGDCTDYYKPFSQETAYLDFAQSFWGGGLASWLWDRAAGAHGYDDGDDEADRAATVLWHQPLVEVSPATLLPASQIWSQRGLYYYRSGWSDSTRANDVVVSFYSGAFQGGHAQEDQNQFTLTAYGERFAIDHGAGAIASQTRAHNLVLIDGMGEHYAGASIGTDGRLSPTLLGGGVDFLEGDATAAYTTYSPYNNKGVPFPWCDWSWGYRDANPVLHARRRLVVVHDGPETPAYLLVVDDINKDGRDHQYEWRLHTDASHQVLIGGDAVRVTGTNALMNVCLINPPVSRCSITTSWFDNGSQDPNSRVISITTTAADPMFTVLLMPRPAGAVPPPVATTVGRRTRTTTIAWSDRLTDVIVTRWNTATTRLEEWPEIAASTQAGADASSTTTSADVSTDASLAVVRVRDGAVVGYLLVDATRLSYDGVRLVTLGNGPANVAMWDNVIQLGQPVTSFAFRAPAGATVECGGVPVGATRDGELLVAGTGSRPVTPKAAALSLRVHPNPFNPTVHVALSGPEGAPARVVIYDVAGRRVRRLWDGLTGAGGHALTWDGRDDAGARVASGVYFVMARVGTQVRTVKVTLVE